MSTKSNVAARCTAYVEMSQDWQMIDDLLGGTRSMREAGIRWLPQEEKESAKAYNVRVERSFLYGALKDTMRRLRGKPFSRDVTIKGKLPARLQGIEKNIDGQGQNLTQFAAACFDAAQNRGLVHILVEYPSTQREPGEGPESIKRRVTASVEVSLRPYLVMIRADEMLGWEYGVDESGTRRLSMIRFLERVTERDGKWGDKQIDQVRVVTPTSWAIYRQSDGKGEWLLHKKGSITLGEIPLATCYFNRTGYMTAEPPLVELAWLNVAHWCSSSDQNHILRFSRFGILFGKGITKDDRAKMDIMGPSRLITAESTNADLKVVEGTGSALGAGRTDVLDIEARMEVLGLQPLMERTGDATATGRAMDESRSQNDVQTWVRALEASMLDALRFAAKWVGADIGEDQAVDIFNDFGISLRASDDIRNLIALRQAGSIDALTLLREVRRRGLLAEDVKPEDVLAAVENEAPLDGTMGLDEPPPPPTKPDDPEDEDEDATRAA